MMLEPGWRSGRWISPSPARGPEPIQRRSLQILVRLTATTLQRAASSSTSASWPAWASKWLSRLANGMPVSLGELRDDRGGEPRRGVEAGAGGGAAQRQLAGDLRRRAATRARPSSTCAA